MDVIGYKQSQSPATPPARHPHTLSACLRMTSQSRAAPQGDRSHPSPRPKEGARIISPPSQRKRGSNMEHGSQGVPLPTLPSTQPTLTLLQSPPAWPCSEQPSADPRMRPLSPPTTTTAACTTPRLMNASHALNQPSVLPHPTEPGGPGWGSRVTQLPLMGSRCRAAASWVRFASSK